MEQIRSVAELKASISALEIKHVHDGQLLKNRFSGIIENLHPQLISPADAKDNLIDTTLSLTAGYLSKKIAVGSTHNPFKQLLGLFLEIGVMNFVSKHSEGIQSAILYLTKYLMNKKKEFA
jgi:hypothetical protein